MTGNEQRERAKAFRELHYQPQILVLPNAWDVASACILVDAGFPAIGTTSSGVSMSLGYPDGERIGRDEMLAAVRRIAGSVPVPVTADLEAGYGSAPEDVAETVRRAIEAGAVGANIEDGTRRAGDPLFEPSLAVERVAAAREAADAAGLDFVVNARTDGFLAPGAAGPAALDESVHRANAYRRAGADSLFVPGVRDAPTIRRLAEEIDGPLNVLAGPGVPPVAELESLGVSRVSVGGGIARAAITLVARAARELRERGTYSFTDGTLTNAELARLLPR